MAPIILGYAQRIPTHYGPNFQKKFLTESEAWIRSRRRSRNAALIEALPQRQMLKHVTSFVPPLCAALLAAVTLISLGSRVAHAAGNCLTEPNLQAGQRGYWYYRIDRSTRRKCWYVGPRGIKVRRAPQPTAQPSPKPIPRPAIDTPAQATAGEKTPTVFSVRWSGDLEPVRSMGSETVLTRDAERDERSETTSRNEVPPIWPVLTDAEPAAAQPANRQHMPELFGAALAFAALLAFAAIGWTMFARMAVRRLGRRRLLDRSAKLRNRTVRIEEPRTEFASTVTASRYTGTAPEPAPDPSSDRLHELKEIHRQLEELEADPPSDRLHELKEIHRQLEELEADPPSDRLHELKETHRHLEELLRLLQGPERTAA